ncbi:hypothetical protein PAPYR_5516 [Paratrimastix pyriformis]|uniref:Uncharacterized protein n=1 Tax=Paratrimastix pyriformis TaxID=342808 RepID=A0ABQ8UKK2_9EUKA|nr:hypothetical protein PAPYR_5516 [Paratrimastix pyriformis]
MSCDLIQFPLSLLALCASQGFNTLGWFKHACPEANRRHWTSATRPIIPSDGLTRAPAPALALSPTHSSDPACGFYRRTRPAAAAPAVPASDGWEFLQGDDYGGCDICCRAELRNNIGALKASAQTLPNCVGFNTNGWFKHSCSEANRGHWTSDPACGFYRRTDGWEFLQGVDYGGCDICCRADLCNNIEALKAHAATLPNCVVRPPPPWKGTSQTKVRGMFSGRMSMTRAGRRDGDRDRDGDGDGTDETPLGLIHLHALCAAQGFNTLGWFKHTCPEANRRHWTSDPACGFYRRTRPAPAAAAPASDGWEFLQGDDYGGCDICCRADLCNNIEALKAHAATLPGCVHPVTSNTARTDTRAHQNALATGDSFAHGCSDIRAVSSTSLVFCFPVTPFLLYDTHTHPRLHTCLYSPSISSRPVLTHFPLLRLSSGGGASQGFNTNGWFKHACPEANRGHWTSARAHPQNLPSDDVLTSAPARHSSDPACGFYRRVRPVPEVLLANLAL